MHSRHQVRQNRINAIGEREPQEEYLRKNLLNAMREGMRDLQAASGLTTKNKHIPAVFLLLYKIL